MSVLYYLYSRRSNLILKLKLPRETNQGESKQIGRTSVSHSVSE